MVVGSGWIEDGVDGRRGEGARGGQRCSGVKCKCREGQALSVQLLLRIAQRVI